ncbi:MAG: hypothetical protein RSB77_04920 [Bacilli bacterium]
MRKIGLLVPKTNLTVEYELQYLYATKFFDLNDFVCYVSKLDYKTNYKDNKEQYLKDLADDSIKKIKDLKYLGVEYISYFCTSSALFNEEKVISINPATSLVEEAKYKNINSCLLITPYNDTIGNKVRDELTKNNIFVSKTINLDLLNTMDYFEFGTKKMTKFIESNYLPEYGDIIISCTNLPTLKTIELLEKKLKINIISSNSSLFNKIKREN